MYLGYLSINKENNIILTPKLYSGDKFILGHYYGFGNFQWKEVSDVRSLVERPSVLPNKIKHIIQNSLLPDKNINLVK